MNCDILTARGFSSVTNIDNDNPGKILFNTNMQEQQNFSIQDILGAMGGGGNRGGGGGGGNIGNFIGGTQSGIARTWAGGLNYNDVWGKKTSVSGSYFYNNMNTNNDNANYRETFATGDSSLFNNSTTTSNNKNQNHRFNFEIEHKFDSSNSIQIRPGFSNQHNESFSETNTFTTTHNR